MTKIVQRKSGTPLSADALRQLEKLKRTKQKIDLSDQPELDDQFFSRAVRNPYVKPVKEQLTLRLDADVIAWARRKGPGYQTRLNSALRSLMLKDLEQTSRRPRQKAS